ncbi:MAG TPA: class I SAM-dependent methyltransferase [Vicinamibacterales bacterium]|nr:class I SAM-dependent methyltransferase [Vicinamibacterales bacterium]
MTPSQELRQQFGEIDIYLFDQLARGRFDGRTRILDAGCGAGRNLPFFLAHGFEVHAIDADAQAIAAVERLGPGIDARRGELDRLPWEAGSMDAVIASAVLHFARDEAHFDLMVQELWRVLRPNGLFFARLASSIGIEPWLGGATGRMRLPDGSARFVVDEAMLLAMTDRLGGTLLDPLKTTNVQNQRAMTTWVVGK